MPLSPAADADYAEDNGINAAAHCLAMTSGIRPYIGVKTRLGGEKSPETKLGKRQFPVPGQDFILGHVRPSEV